MQVVYVGVSPEVEVVDQLHVDRLGVAFSVLAQRDVPLEVPEEVAQRLLQQPGNWQQAEPKKAGK